MRRTRCFRSSAITPASFFGRPAIRRPSFCSSLSKTDNSITMTQIFFSQCIAVLCSEAPGLAELRRILEREGYTIKADEDMSDWPEMQGAGLTLATSFENGATCLVDICDFPWPDDLGVTGDPTLLTGAHVLGAFGPFAHPGAFERALQAPEYQSVAPDARNHRAFVRFRVSRLIPSDAGSEASFASTENANPAWEIAYLLRQLFKK